MNDNKPLISVIMSVYNEEKYIDESLKSILNQTVKDFELIIVNDCSTDNTKQIIDELAAKDSRIKLIDNEQNMGLTRNLNKALAYARGEYIARMDGDDISMPNRFETQIKYLEEHPDIMLISCNTTTFGEKKLVSDIAGTPEELRCKMLLRPQLAHPGFMMRAKLITEYGFGYDEHFRSAQDYDFAARVTTKLYGDDRETDNSPKENYHNIAVTKEVLLQYRAHAGQVSQTPNLKQFGYADEIRQRLLARIDITLDAEALDAYHHWVLESPADDETYRINKKILQDILRANADKQDPLYDCKILKKTLWKQYFVWMLRAGGVSKIVMIAGVRINLYASFVATAIQMIISKKRRNRQGNK